MIPGLDLNEVSGFGVAVALLVFLFVAVTRENLVPGRAYRRVLDQLKTEQETSSALARALDAQRVTSEAATRLMTVPVPSDTSSGASDVA